MGRGDLIGNGDRHLVPASGGGEEPVPQQRNDRRPPGPAAVPKGRVIEVAPKRGDRRNERMPATTPFMAPPSKVKPSILSTIKAKPKAGRK